MQDYLGIRGQIGTGDGESAEWQANPHPEGDSIARYFLRKQYWFEFKRQNITGRTTDKDKLGARLKVLLRKTGDSIIATYEESGIFPEQSLYFLYDFNGGLSPLYLFGILNTKLMTWYYKTASLTNKNSIAQVKKVQLDQLPIMSLSRTTGAGKGIHDEIVALVLRMLALQKQLTAAKSVAQRAILQRQVDTTDAAIDRLAYDLYGLTDQEISIIENSNSESS